MRTLLALAAAALAVPTGAAQTAPPRPYVLVDAGGGVVPNRLDDGVAERVQNAHGWAGAVEAGAVRGRTGVGLRVEGYRARRGDPGALGSLLPSDDLYDATQVNALVVVRREFAVGPLLVVTGSGAGAGLNVSGAQEVTGSGSVRGGAAAGAVATVREGRVLPLVHLDASVGGRVGRTFVGLGAGTSSALGEGTVARYGVQVRRAF